MLPPEEADHPGASRPASSDLNQEYAPESRDAPAQQTPDRGVYGIDGVLAAVLDRMYLFCLRHEWDRWHASGRVGRVGSMVFSRMRAQEVASLHLAPHSEDVKSTVVLEMDMSQARCVTSTPGQHPACAHQAALIFASQQCVCVCVYTPTYILLHTFTYTHACINS